MNRLLFRPVLRVQQPIVCQVARGGLNSALYRRYSAKIEGNQPEAPTHTPSLLNARVGGKRASLPLGHKLLDPTLFFEAWHSEATQQALSAKGQTAFEYLSLVIESPEGVKLLKKLDESKSEELFEIWKTFWRPPTGTKQEDYLDDVLAFWLNNGVRLLPPSAESNNSSESILPMTRDERVEFAKLSKLPEKYPTQFVPYPNLMTPDALLDPHDVLDLPATPTNPFHNRVIVRNHRSIFHTYPDSWEADLASSSEQPKAEASPDEMLKALPVTPKYYSNLHQSILMRRTVIQQTGKGKIRRVAFMVLVGDGNGLVGYGEGKHANGAVALKLARLAAVRNMDWVERFEKRTIWTEMSTKLGATELHLRPRPVGFGLRCNPYLHMILRAAGLKDISAKVWGSRNRLNVIKAAFRVLQAGHAPTGMGDGVGGGGKKLSKGGGLKSKGDLERARGRKLISLRK